MRGGKQIKEWVKWDNAEGGVGGVSRSRRLKRELVIVVNGSLHGTINYGMGTGGMES